MSNHDQLNSMRLYGQRRMVVVLIIIVCFMLVEVAAAWFTHSLALFADAGHMLTDVGAIMLGLIASWFAGKPATPGKTYGYYRSEILAGLVNGLLLVGISLFIIHESWQRLQAPITISPTPVFFVAVIALLINLICLRLLHPTDEHKEHKSINIKAAVQEIYADAMVTVGVIISSIIIYFTHWYQADAVVSLCIGFFILPRTWGLLRECTNILMEGTPEHIDLVELRSSMLSVPSVIDAHDIHVWTITSGLDSMSAHVSIDKQANPEEVLEAITKVLQEKFNLNHTTIQIEQAHCQTEANICS